MGIIVTLSQDHSEDNALLKCEALEILSQCYYLAKIFVECLVSKFFNS